MVSRFIGASACAFVLLAAPAYATDKCVNPGGTGGCFPTIQAAHDDVTTVDGDTITVEAGTYAAPQTIVSKGVTIDGAGAGLTIVDGTGADPALTGTFRITANSDVAIQELTIRNPSGPPASRSALGVKSLAPATLTFDALAIQGRASGDYGMYADNCGADIEFSNSSIRNVANNPILMERHDGATDIHDNVIDAAFGIVFFTYSGDNVPAPQRVADNTITSSGSGVASPAALSSEHRQLHGRRDRGQHHRERHPRQPDLGRERDLAVERLDGHGAPTVSSAMRRSPDNRLTWVGRPPNPVNTASRGISITGRVEGTQINGNSALGYGTALRAVNATAGHGQSGTVVRFNRFGGQNTAYENGTGGAIDAEHNWWGCNEGPGNPGCGTVAGAGPVDFDPWLVLGVSASPTSIQTGGQQSTITAGLRTDSDGDTPAGNQLPTRHRHRIHDEPRVRAAERCRLGWERRLIGPDLRCERGHRDGDRSARRGVGRGARDVHEGAGARGHHDSDHRPQVVRRRRPRRR